ncbi:hypothetical protein UFOVP466_19 [uncultured Caudovirales phage]|uniref:Uncharacterized protein n=1 Tax=uncultured Caudovirales phage TaxID=2100421 RepID=A0A6J5MBT3_9CAUD|nr:hypothetical protein UFOVP466_19 [uncultured Caudovirales phage]CAB4180633.1 hypothetical protein UFOVP1045_66 [uncultured Caudovirales phage]CAB4189921.1 hypothetical protein UFOVP1194_20 [uncultured Caudovirales phage]CAB4221779.1 hypothetical protein UFOVP1641_16 [uncultured Caudovirales phage]
MKTKTAYLIRSGTIHSAVNVSNKLRSFKGSRRALLAAKRMGFTEAYAAKMTVEADAVLK